jgi:plasmid stability protein
MDAKHRKSCETEILMQNLSTEGIHMRQELGIKPNQEEGSPGGAVVTSGLGT